MTSKGSRQVLFVEELKKAMEKSERPGRGLQRPERRWEEMGEGPRENQLDFFFCDVFFSRQRKMVSLTVNEYHIYTMIHIVPLYVNDHYMHLVHSYSPLGVVLVFY